MSAGDIILDALGRVQLHDDGDTHLSDGEGDECCGCGPISERIILERDTVDPENQPHDILVAGVVGTFVKLNQFCPHEPSGEEDDDNWQTKLAFYVREAGEFDILVRCEILGSSPDDHLLNLAVRVNGAFVGFFDLADSYDTGPPLSPHQARLLTGVNLSAGDVVEITDAHRPGPNYGSDLGGTALNHSQHLSAFNDRLFPFAPDAEAWEPYGFDMVISGAQPDVSECPAEDTAPGDPEHDGQISLTQVNTMSQPHLVWEREDVKHSSGDWKLSDRLTIDSDTCTIALTRSYWRGGVAIPAWFGQTTIQHGVFPIVIPRLFGCDFTASYSVE